MVTFREILASAAKYAIGVGGIIYSYIISHSEEITSFLAVLSGFVGFLVVFTTLVLNIRKLNDRHKG